MIHDCNVSKIHSFFYSIALLFFLECYRNYQDRHLARNYDIKVLRQRVKDWKPLKQEKRIMIGK